MDWNDFEKRAGAAIPPQSIKAKRCWVGVLLFDKDPRQPLGELDFVWMIGHSKITVEKIFQTYQERQESSDFHLICREGVADKKKTLKDLLKPGSDLVVFRAVRAASLSPNVGAAAPKTPLLDPNGAMSSVGNPAPTTPLTSHFKAEPQEGEFHAAQSSNAVPPATTPYKPTTRVGQSPILTPTLLVNGHHDLAPYHARDQQDPQSNPSKVQEQDNLRSSMARAHHDGQTAIAPAQQSPVPPTIKTNPALNARNSSANHASPVRSSLQPIAYKSPYVAPPSTEPSLATAAQDPRSHELYVPPIFHNEVDEGSQPFNLEHLFNREPSPQGGSQEETKAMDHSIREIIKHEDPVVLEAGVDKALKVLEGFKQAFVQHAASTPDAQAWIESIDKLSPQAKRKRTVVGVVGNTGAGKSSVINAMLDEERLVPTNCMRACTAVVTEMSWNDSNDTFSKYRAEIEFISRADWEKEVATLMKEFMTEHGTLSRDVSDQNSDAGVAWAKFHAVYPKIPRDSLDGCTVANLMADSGLSLLGTTKKINAAVPYRFYHELQKYVDSKEKVTKKVNDKDKDKQKKSFEMEYWPLIKVVKIYTKASALSTGAVIVDLPGVHDSNAARAAVAQGYIKQCTGLWIVAPITRAVDDKAAKTLLGDSFKTQLKYDGGFSNVTFICSKTDDISITDAVDSLELEDEVERLYEQERELQQEIEIAETKIEDLEESRKVYILAQRETGAEIETWEELQEQMDDGKEVFAPAVKPAKRKKNASAKNSRKKRQVQHDDDDFVVSDEEATESEDEEEGDDDDEGVEAPQEPLTEDDIRAKLKSLRESKKNARREGLAIKPKIEELRPQIRDAKTKIKAIKAEISRTCISGRNEYSKRAIQQDFAAGIKELDQENAAEEDEDNFNPDEDIRDYDQVAKALPVFCVSSRAYQKMCGRLQKDDSVPGFNTPEETEMPQLQAHCKQLTEAGRIQTTRNFLLSLCQQLTTFSLWASNDASGVKMTDDDKRKQIRYVERRLDELERGLEKAVEACLNVMKKELNDQIFDKYPDLIQDAINAAPDTAQKWGVHRADGGLAWGTYKAVVRRNGNYHSQTTGHRDFNSELVDPIVKKLATSWERAFQNRLPKAFATFISDSGKILHKFHEAVETRARENGVGLASLSTLKTQIYTYEMLFGELNRVLVSNMTDQQREANRDFTPTIANIMHTVYEICAAEYGRGSFMRMKAHMAAYVEQNRHSMFNEATLTVKRHLDAMCRKLQETMEERADEIYIKMKADYMRVLGGVLVNTEAVMPREERAMRADIMTLLKGVDAHFEPIANGVLPNPGDNNAEVEDGEEEPAVAANDEEESDAYESAHEDATAVPNDDAAMQDSIMQDNDDTGITGPSPGANDGAEKQSELPTLFSNEITDEEL